MPRWPHPKEWGHAGFCFDFVGAIVPHAIVGDPFLQTLSSLSCESLLAASDWAYRQRGVSLGA